MSEQVYEATHRRVLPAVAIDGAIGVIQVGCEVAYDEAVDAALDVLDAVPRAQHDRGLEETQWLREEAENAWSAANLATMAREKAEAETARLRDLVEEFLEGHPSGAHSQATADGRPGGWCAVCIGEWPCLVERARAALHGDDGDDDD